MRFRVLIEVGVLMALPGAAYSQAPQPDNTRQLYYLATPDKGALPAGKPGASNADLGTLNLGLRYNVVLIGRDKHAAQVSADHVFRVGDCFAVDLETNRSGYLYVLARQSSGSWTPLTDMPGQRDAIPQGKRVRIPSGACFTVENPPGTETLFVVLSRDPRDFYELYESVKSSESHSLPQSTNASKTAQVAGTGKVEDAMKHLDEKFGGSRDISIAKVEEPERDDEPAGAVYVVNTSKKPATSLVTKIQVRHD